MQQPSVINMFWIGPRLKWMERLAMASFVANGHAVHLHSYNHIENVPAGVTVKDAALVADRSTVLALTGGRRGSAALAADYFRLVLQKKGLGLWCDTDVICISPITYDPRLPLFGLQTADFINSAVLYLPADSPVIDAMLGYFEPNRVPPWVGANRRRQLWLKKLAFQHFGPTDQLWGALGPGALTWFAKKHDLFPLAQPRAVFYPYDHTRAAEAFQPGSSLSDFITDRTLAVHVFNEALKGLRTEPPPPNSALGELVARYGI